MDQKETTEKSKPRRLDFKSRIILLQTAVIALLLLGAWIFYNRIQAANRYLTTFEILTMEKEKCTSVISQGSGSFDEFQYCSQLLKTFPD